MLMMGNFKSKKLKKESNDIFDRVRRQEKKSKRKNLTPKRIGVKESSSLSVESTSLPRSTHIRSYDEEALQRMRYQLRNEANAFLLNNILLSVQFFENYEREVSHIRSNPTSERMHKIKDAMAHHHKRVTFADRMQECVNKHVGYKRRGQLEHILAPRVYVIYDNVEASVPGDTSDYSAVLDAPFYKLRIEDCKQPGYIKLKKLEVLESSLYKEAHLKESKKEEIKDSDDSLYTDSEKESDSDDATYSKGEELLQKIQTKLTESLPAASHFKLANMKINPKSVDISQRRRSGPIKQVSVQVEKSVITNLSAFRKMNTPLSEEQDINEQIDMISTYEKNESKPRKSILKMTEKSNALLKSTGPKNQYFEASKTLPENTMGEDTESSGYRSNSSSRQTESSETESDYGYSTITASTTPRRLELSIQSNYLHSSGVIPEECWKSIQVPTIDDWSDDDEKNNELILKKSLPRELYDTCHYLSSSGFMINFVDNFMIKLGSSLGFNQDTIDHALTQGANIYCDTLVDGIKMSYEVIPAIYTPSWPNAANHWIIRERRTKTNPRTNLSYQWPTKSMVEKVRRLGCMVIPVEFKQKRNLNPEKNLQWKIIFPDAECYLENCLAHSHVRCYLFALTLHKTFLENESCKTGIDAEYIKNHLFWECEDNYAKWPEDRLGETLRLFLRSFYSHFVKTKFPNYFIENCDDFMSIPHPLLRSLQRKLADILEAPVMHLLYALAKLKYIKKDFYPTFNCNRLYEILTCKNPLRIDKNMTANVSNDDESSDNEYERETQTSSWFMAKKSSDKEYQWKKENLRQIEEKKKLHNKKQKSAEKQEREIKTNIMLPKRLEPERRRLVLEFFIPHFIAMARSSEKFDAIRQALIYLEHSRRLCILLIEESKDDTVANEYLDVIRDKLADCQRKLVNQESFRLPPRMESSNLIPIKKGCFNVHIVTQDSPNDSSGIPAFTFVEEQSPKQGHIKLSDVVGDEESKL